LRSLFYRVLTHTKAALAAILIFTGYKSKVSIFKDFIIKNGAVMPSVITVLAIVMTDL
jgi:hypothetical protein